MTRTPNTSKQTLLLLRELLQAPQSWRHGYELAQATGLKSGTLYPLLLRLADQKLLDARWDVAGTAHRPRHVYRLSRSGAQFARDQLHASRGAAPRARPSLA